MNQATRELYEKATELSAEERAELAGLLLESIEDQEAPRAEIEREWATEVERRLAEYRAGRMDTVSWEDLRAHLHRSDR
jgi:putative addiction module component (TIGR02574 family)